MAIRLAEPWCISNLVYFKSAAGCIQCHESAADPMAGQDSPLGPDLARLGDEVTDVHLVETLTLGATRPHAGTPEIGLV